MTLIRPSTLLITALLTTTSLSQAERFALPTQVIGVDLHPDGARIARAGTLALPAGEHEIRLVNLPTRWRAETLSLMVGGVEGLQIVSTGYQTNAENTDVRAEIDALDARLEALATAARAHRQRTATLSAEQAMVETFLADPALFSARADASEFWAFLITRHGELAPLMAALAAELASIDEQRRTLRETRAELVQDLETREARLTLTLPTAGTIGVQADYISSQARWQPGFEVHLTSANHGPSGDIELRQLAEVYQDTGEDWAGVAAVLHGVSLNSPIYTPAAATWQINEIRMEPHRLGDSVATAELFLEDGRAAMAAEMPLRAPAPQAQVIQGSFSARYVLDTALTLPSSTQEWQQMTLAAGTAAADLWAQGLASHSQAMVMAGFDNPLTSVSLPSQARVFRDGAYIGSQYLAALQPGEALSLPFGPDPLVTIRQQTLRDARDDGTLLNRRNSRTQIYETRVENAHTYAMPIRLIRATPVAGHGDIGVAIVGESDGFDLTDIGGQTGVNAWHFTLDPAGSAIRTYGHKITWPEEMNIGL